MKRLLIIVLLVVQIVVLWASLSHAQSVANWEIRRYIGQSYVVIRIPCVDVELLESGILKCMPTFMNTPAYYKNWDVLVCLNYDYCGTTEEDQDQ